MHQGKIFHNAKWIIGCKIIQALIQMIIGMLTARYLGPANYGLVNYAASLTAFVLPFMQLGLQSTLVQEYILAPEKNGEILGTAMVMTLVSGTLSMLGVVGFSLVANWGETTTIVVCVLYSITLLCQSLELIQYWFQARMLSKYSSLAMLGAYIVVSAYKVFLLVTGKSVYWFALSHAVEYGASGVLMFILQCRLGTQKLRFSLQTAGSMLSRSKYYILSAMMVTIFQNTDHVMLKLMCGDVENGYYTAAVTCVCLANFVYNGIIDAARPAFLESRRESVAAFEGNITRLYSVIIWLTVAQCIVFEVLAEPIVLFLYAQNYRPAISVLRVLVWLLPFSYIGSVRNVWILGMERYSILWKINLSGVVANVFLNAVMIPLWGACGAALASVLTQFVANLVTGFLMPPLRRNNQLMLRGLDPRNLVDLLRRFLLNRVH